MAVARDGAVAVAVQVIDHREGDPWRAESYRAVVVSRSPQGGFDDPQVLGLGADPPKLATDGQHGFLATWTQVPDGADQYANKLLEIADAPEGGVFGSPRTLSDPATSALDPSLLTAGNGDAFVLWNATAGRSQPAADGSVPPPAIPGGAELSLRPGGGDWETPINVSGTPAGAINDRGDALLAWSCCGDVYYQRRLPGHRFGPEQTIPPENHYEGALVALDSYGTGILLGDISSGAIAGPSRFVGRTLPIGGPPTKPETILDAPTRAGMSQPAMDDFGNGIIPIVERPDGGDTEIFTATYSATPPRISDVSVSSRRIRFRLSEPSRVRVSVRRGSRRAALTRREPAGTIVLQPTAAMRALSRAGSRIVATITATDAGAGTSSQRRLVPRR